MFVLILIWEVGGGGGGLDASGRGNGQVKLTVIHPILRGL